MTLYSWAILLCHQLIHSWIMHYDWWEHTTCVILWNWLICLAHRKFSTTCNYSCQTLMFCWDLLSIMLLECCQYMHPNFFHVYKHIHFYVMPWCHINDGRLQYYDFIWRVIFIFSTVKFDCVLITRQITLS